MNADPSPAGPADASGVSLRPETAADERFLFEVYASTRANEMKSSGLPPAQQELFLQNQFALRRAHYARVFPHASRSIVVRQGRDAGVLTVNRDSDEIRVVDLALLPRYCGHGIGSGLLKALLDEARAAGKPVRLRVRKDNAARQLYLRLGFAPTGDHDLYLDLEWRANRP
ncbi:MAG TPA: GNAT family N-acetyltransferase [Opitutus sp.]|nr:GNAT family N-acetyltransferase [Opitutus sp.]